MLLFDSLLLTARNTTFCSCGEQCSCVVDVMLDLLGLDEDDEDLDTEDDLEGEADLLLFLLLLLLLLLLFLLGLMNLKGEALYLGLMSRTWVSSSLHLTLLGL